MDLRQRRANIYEQGALLYGWRARERSSAMKATSPARAAREAAGLGREEVAKRAGITLTYLQRVERVGASYVLARRLARIYGCAIDSFLPPPGGGTQRKGGGRRRTSRPRMAESKPSGGDGA